MLSDWTCCSVALETSPRSVKQCCAISESCTGTCSCECGGVQCQGLTHYCRGTTSAQQEMACIARKLVPCSALTWISGWALTTTSIIRDWSRSASVYTYTTCSTRNVTSIRLRKIINKNYLRSITATAHLLVVRNGSDGRHILEPFWDGNLGSTAKQLDGLHGFGHAFQIAAVACGKSLGHV